AGKKSAQIREILISESAWEEMTCLFAPSLALPLLLPFVVMDDKLNAETKDAVWFFKCFWINFIKLIPF
ncbi:hypothetical protein QL288_24620, partial [Citrobacter youngae]|nr:hypothetical protein [Citrobacter youngae]